MISSISRNAASRRAEKTARENLSTLIPQELRAQYIDNQPGSMATKVDQAALAYITMLQNEINVKDQEATNRGRRIRCMTRVMDYFGLTERNEDSDLDEDDLPVEDTATENAVVNDRTEAEPPRVRASNLAISSVLLVHTTGRQAIDTIARYRQLMNSVGGRLHVNDLAMLRHGLGQIERLVQVVLKAIREGFLGVGDTVSADGLVDDMQRDIEALREEERR